MAYFELTIFDTTALIVNTMFQQDILLFTILYIHLFR